MKTVFTYAHVKWFYSQSEHMYYLNYNKKSYKVQVITFSYQKTIFYFIIQFVENFEKLQRVHLELKLETSPF